MLSHVKLYATCLSRDCRRAGTNPYAPDLEWSVRFSGLNVTTFSNSCLYVMLTMHSQKPEKFLSKIFTSLTKFGLSMPWDKTALGPGRFTPFLESELDVRRLEYFFWLLSRIDQEITTPNYPKIVAIPTLDSAELISFSTSTDSSRGPTTKSPGRVIFSRNRKFWG